MGTPKLTDWGFVGLLGLLWGGSFVFAEYALVAFGPITIASGRLLLGGLLLFSFFRMRGGRLPLSFTRVREYVILGTIGNAIPFSLIFFGQQWISAGLAAILTCATPFFTAFLAHFLTSDERLDLKRLVGLILGMAGVAVTVGLDTFEDLDNGLIGQLAVLGAALGYAIYGIYARTLDARNPQETATGSVLAGGLVLLPLALLAETPVLAFSALPVVPLLAIAGLGLIGTAIPFVLYFWLIRRIGANNISLGTMVAPISASGLGILLLNETVRQQYAVGFALLVLGFIVIDGRAFRKVRQLFGLAPKTD